MVVLYATKNCEITIRKELLIMQKVTTFFKEATSKVSSGFKKASLMGSAALCTVEASVMNTFADTTASPEEADATMDSTMQSILGFIYKIFRYVGILLLVWAIIQIVMAFKNDDADSKQKGMVLAVISVMLIFIGTLVGPILDAAHVWD